MKLAASPAPEGYSGLFPQYHVLRRMRFSQDESAALSASGHDPENIWVRGWSFRDRVCAETRMRVEQARDRNGVRLVDTQDTLFFS